MRWTAAVAALAVGCGLIAAPATTASASTGTGLARFYQQRLTWHGCQQGPDDADGQALDAAGAQCADVTVPLDYSHPDRRAITVAISRLKATDTAGRIGSLLINLGGPAIPAIGIPVLAQQAMGDTGARFDLIGMDRRFVGRSTPLDCGLPAGWIPRSAGTDRKSFDRMVRLMNDLADRCARQRADLLPYASTANAARDMDVIRAALGEPKLSYLGYSQGTYLGALYTQLFPKRADRFVLDSAIDPTQPGTRVLRTPENAPRREAALRTWAGRAAQHDDQFHLGATADAVLATVQRIYQASARQPLHVGQFRVDDTVLPGLLVDPLSDDSDASSADLAAIVQVLVRAVDTGSAEPTPDLDATLAGLLTGAQSSKYSAMAAIMCADAAVPRDPQSYWRDVQAHRAGEPIFGPLDFDITPCAFWPAGAVHPAGPVHNAVPSLVVQAAEDINANYEQGLAMHRALTGSRLITLDDVRTHGVYGFWGSACVDDTVNGYLRTGVLPARDVTCARS
jgi:pimeloyl-ACP methyl ester carboxylesterase